ncbi:hypothetical protein SAMN04488075_0529 [Paracoccus alkenifer]|uniref:Uncharacterized protein n=1 Tax=Paracoccus alkenifer TaxID=65735 RepID=A0A1H6JT30_9RHOB|nr:hypothetical protein SAMN04488075_0529 [Paracoccus alkenifer]
MVRGGPRTLRALGRMGMVRGDRTRRGEGGGGWVVRGDHAPYGSWGGWEWCVGTVRQPGENRSEGVGCVVPTHRRPQRVPSPARIIARRTGASA